MRNALSSLAMALCVALPVFGQQHPNLDRGFNSGKVYDFSGVDSIDDYSGALTVRIPVGLTYPVSAGLSYGLTLMYNSNHWEYETIIGTVPIPGSPETTSGECLIGLPSDPADDGASNAGLGWRLSFGRYLDPYSPGARDLLHDTYESPDGAAHAFYDTLHEEDAADGKAYSRDGSYLRRTVSGGQVIIEHPDGHRSIFEEATPGNHDWRLVRMTDAVTDGSGGYVNHVDVDYVTNAQGDVTQWVVTDSAGRTLDVYFRTDGNVDHVVVPAFDGTTTTYAFAYNTTSSVTRSFKTTCLDPPPQVPVQLLVSVTAASGGTTLETWTFPDYLLSASEGQESGGMLKAMVLPTLGRLEWSYGENIFYDWDKIQECSREALAATCGQQITYGSATGVATKTLIAPDVPADRTRTWTYAWTGNVIVYQNPLREVMDEKVTVVTSPPRDDSGSVTSTVHYFNAYVGVTSKGNWDYSLPFGPREEQAGGRYLSSQTFDGAVTVTCTDTCEPSALGQLKRAEYVLYDHDRVPTEPSTGLPVQGVNAYNTNRRVLKQRTVYNDDAGRYADLDNDGDDFDGLGHYRRQTTGGNFGAGDVRETYTAYNPGALTYPGTFMQFPASQPWILGTYTYQRQTESSDTARQEFSFDPDTGFLLSKRTMIHPDAEHADNNHDAADLLATFTADPYGNVATETYSGGDAGNAYEIDNTYEYGVLKTSKYATASYYTVDRDIDPTGLIAASRDTAGIGTDYDWDGLGRLTGATPPAGEGAAVTYTYTPAATGTPPRVDARWWTNPGGAQLAHQYYTYDGFGRLEKEYALLPDGSYNKRLTVYNAMGWKTKASELEASTVADTALHVTEYSGFDPFGRAGTITAPDGSVTTMTYAGVRQVERTVQIATSTSDQSSATTTETYDRQGRLVSVQEPSGPSGAQVTTSYGYDVGGRLASVTTPSGGTTQQRTFSYDHRGFLLSETLPEKGLAGNGTVSYPSYDARGHVLRKVDGPSDLSFAYDICERLTTVTDHATSQLLKSFAYASSSTSGDWANGKLHSSTSHNRLASGPDATVTETLTYGGVGGAVSQRQIALSYPQAVTFTQGFTWTDLGKLQAETYPDGAGVGPERTVIYTYGNGSLTEVDQQVGSAPVSTLATLTYHPNGMVRTVAHANGVTDTIEIDADAMARPYSIATSGAVAGSVTRTPADWSTGIYDYDGAGNITHMGGDHFTYDLVSRLATSAQQVDGTKARAFDYDAFGNMKTMTIEDSSTRDFNVQAATNRLGKGGGTGFTADYDAAGNMTSLTDDAGFNRTFTWYPTGAMQRGRFGSSRTVDHAYDADGERVLSEDSGYLGSQAGSPEAGVHVTLRGLDAKVRRELLAWDDGGTWRWQWQRDTVWRDGQILAAVSSNPSAVERHYTVDHLGTPRLLTDALGVVASRHTYFPYGEEATNPYADNGKQLQENHRFTGHERDLVDLGATTDDLDYMHARYYSPMVGRFLRLDPARDLDSKAPQTLNKYGYVKDNPTGHVDPDGRLLFFVVGGTLETDENGKTKYVPPPPAQQKSQADAVNFFATGLVAGVSAPAARVATKPASRLLVKVKEALGFFPKKPGGGGLMQAFSRLTGQYVEHGKTMEGRIDKFAASAAGEVTSNAFLGWAKSQGAEVPLPITTLGKWSMSAGEAVGNVVTWIKSL